MNFGSGKYTYSLVKGWGMVAAGWTLGEIVGLAVDAQDRVFVASRSQHPLAVFDTEGNLLETWGDDVLFTNQAHGLFIDSVDNVYFIDAVNHCLLKFDRMGALVMTLGTPGQAAIVDGAPFSGPTDAAVASTGELYVSDGYGNARVHKYSAAGELLLTWGERGDGLGQFSISHSVRVDAQDRVWICDRENNRVQIFDSNGEYLRAWNDLLRPNTIHFDPHEPVVYVAELGRRLSIFALDDEGYPGRLLAQWADLAPSETPGFWLGGPHGICTDRAGNLYVGEVELGVQGRMWKYQRN